MCFIHSTIWTSPVFKPWWPRQIQKLLETLHPWATTLDPLTDEECLWPMMQLNILVGISGSWCSCGCFQIHQIHSNIVLDIRWLASPMYHIWILGILRPGGGLQLFVTLLRLFLSSFYGTNCPPGATVVIGVCLCHGGCASSPKVFLLIIPMGARVNVRIQRFSARCWRETAKFFTLTVSVFSVTADRRRIVKDQESRLFSVL